VKFVAVVYEHAARFLGERPWDVSRDPDLMFRAHAAAFRRYGHNPVVPGIDIYNVEAECYGARVVDPGGNGVPAIERPFCAGVADLNQLPPLDPTRGRLADVLRVARRLRREAPSSTIAVPVSGPFSIASHLLGFEELLTAILTDQDALRRGLEHLVENQKRVCRRIAAEGFDTIIFDSAAGPPLLSPRAFHELAGPILQGLVGEVRRMLDRPVSLIVGGDTVSVLDDLVATGADHLLCPAETDQALFMRKISVHPEPVVRINMSPGVFSGGDEEAAVAEARRVIHVGRERENVCIGSGVIPYDAVPEVVCRVRDFVENQTGLPTGRIPLQQR
jgi:uroporphyrinogen decarboxylase